MKSKVILITFLLNYCLANGQTNKFQTIVERYNKEKNFNGAMVIATNGKIDYLSGIGISNRESGVKLTPQSKFKIASMTKAFTAVLIMKLYEDGKIELNATIGKYFPAYKGEAIDKVTIHQLLTYSSGIENLSEPAGMESYQQKLTLDEYMKNYL